MLIVFDLDDTLVDTTGCITYHLLEKALEAMVQEGLVIADFAEALLLLRRLNDRALSAKHALSEFVEIFEGDAIILEKGMAQIYEIEASPLSLSPLPGAVEVLSALKLNHCLTLVTIGRPQFQRGKLKKAGIDSSLFSKILVSEEESKGPLYEGLLEEFGFSRWEVWVCGDRIARDLSPAKRLGFHTVLMKWGRGLNAALPHPDVDYVVSSLREFMQIIHNSRHKR